MIRQRAAAAYAPVSAAAAERRGTASFLALMVLNTVMFLSPQAYFPILAPLRLALIAAIAGVVTLLFERVRRGEPVMTAGREIRWGLGLVGWSVLTIPFSLWPGGSVEYVTGFYVKNFVVAWLISEVVRDLRRLRRLEWGFSLLAGVVSVMAIRSFATGQFLQVGAPVNRIWVGDGSLTGNPNDLALLLNIVLPLTVMLLLTERKPIRRFVLVCIAGLVVAGIVATFSRGGFVTLCVSAALLMWRYGRRRGGRWVWFVVPVALAMVPLIPDSYRDRMTTISNIESDPTGSSQQRWSDMESAFTYVANHPVLGSGIGMNVLALNQVRGATWMAVHNVYLQIAVEIGIPGLLLFLGLFRSCLTAAARASRRGAGAERDHAAALADGVWISLVAFAVAAVFHPVAFHVFFYLLVGLAIAARNAAGISGRAVAEAGGPRPRPGLRFAGRSRASTRSEVIVGPTAAVIAAPGRRLFGRDA